jgi:cysteinyl-tRNA synthetase
MFLFSFEAIQQSVHSALCDNFDTPSVLRALYELIHEVNLYIQAHRRRVNIFLLTRIAHYLYRLLTVFGLNIKLPSSLSLVSPFAVGITANSSSSSVMTAATKSISVDSNALLCTLIKFREETRKHILNYDKNEWTTVQQQILKLTDQMRAQLLEWGVQLEDHEHATRIRVQSPDTTPASKQQLEEMRQKSRQRQEELARLATIPPQEYLRDDTKFSAYDELGIPTHTITGSPLSSSQRKKLEKRYYKHKRAYERYCASLPTNKPTTQPQQQFDGTKDIESHKKN